uniref:Microtubule-associated protein futsch n=1 Tax=Anopheles culicifacies TaxID=139723 RepID=A0A182LW96_9DIPT
MSVNIGSTIYVAPIREPYLLFEYRKNIHNMGNTLCKEPRTGSSPSTGNAFSNFSSVICPNGLGKGKTQPMRKTYFSRSAVDASKKTTSATGWQSVGLHVPDGSGRQQKVIDTPPVAPPRKKRGATLDGRYRSDEALKVKNGFQDVFGRESRRHSCDVPSVTRPASMPPPRPDVAALPARQTSCFEIDASNDAFSDFSKVPTTAELEKTPSTSQIPRVGNRKSDKFFGERLADSLSPDQQTPSDEQKKPKKDKSNPSLVREDVDKIEKFVESKDTLSEVRPKQETQLETRESNVSPDPNTKEGEDLMKYIDRTVARDNQIGRRAEFLMAMLEDYNDSVRYEGMQPVEEPLIVPKRRKSKHICDDHDHMHNKLQAHERDASVANVIRTEVSIEHAPRKPSRDFSRYKPIDVDPSSGGSDGEQSSAVRPVRTKQKTKQRDTASPLPPPPPSEPPRFQKSLSEVQLIGTATSTPLEPPKDHEEPKAHTPRMLKRIISMPTTENLVKEPSSRTDTPQRPVLTKSSSSGSFSSVDLQRTRICVERFTPEDYAHRTSGADELVKPKSKLTTRKISWKSNEAPVCQSATPTADRPTGPSFTIGDSTVVTSDSASQLALPDVPTRKHSAASTEPESAEPEKEVLSKSLPPSSAATLLADDAEDSSLRKFCLGSFIESSRLLPHHDVVNVLDCVYTASDNKENIVEQFQTFLEEALSAELNEPNTTNPNVSKLLEKLSQTSSDGDKQLENVTIKLVGSSRSSSDMDDCFDPEFEKIEKSEVVGELPKIEHGLKHAGGRRRDSIEYMSDWFGTESDGSTTMLSTVGTDEVKANDRTAVKPPMHSASYGKRKESIEDVGSWFSKHNVLRPSFGEEFEEPSRRLRRGSDGFLGYDLQRQYPFGRERSDSLSAEMFEGITKLQEHRIDQQGERPIPEHPQRKKVLEHRNSSDALLMKVLTRTNRATQHHNTEEHKHQQTAQPTPQEGSDSTGTESVEESKPLLNADAPQNSSEPDPATDASKAAKKDAIATHTSRPEKNEHEHSEHSTLLKFLSQEKLIE